jgi:two-component system nitrogen regulation sensor histidine kinase NtrY
MVDEFSSFGRMPGPSIAEHDLCELIRQTVFLQRNAAPTIEFNCDLPEGPVIQPCDSQQLDRALLNLLQNATDSIEARVAADGPGGAPGVIRVRLTENEGGRAIRVEDNGLGLPKKQRRRLTEPYVTTRARGTGLGLAIVQKIMEDHGGHLLLEDGSDGGACVSLVFPAIEETASPGRRRPVKTRSVAPHGA